MLHFSYYKMHRLCAFTRISQQVVQFVVEPRLFYLYVLSFFFFQEVKKTSGSVHLIRDKSDPDKVVPDVYSYSLAALKDANRKRQNITNRPFLTKRYKPVLEPILEDVENSV